MYYYIIDPQKTSQKNFERVQNQLYANVADLRISGEMTRVTTLRNISQLVETALMRGATTIVGVGHDSTIQEIVNAVGEKDIVIGYVPVETTNLSTILGIGDVVEACQSLAHRRVESLDLGHVQGAYFFTEVFLGADLNELQPKSLLDFGGFSKVGKLQPMQIKLAVDGQYSASFEVVVGSVLNSRAAKSNNGIADPTDGILDVLLLPGLSGFDAWKYRAQLASGELEKIPGCAVVHGNKITISGPEGLTLIAGGRVIAKAPAVIDFAAKKVKMVVGRGRLF